MLDILEKALLQMFDVPPDVALSYFFCMLMGVMVNWLWKCRREKIDPIKYWTTNKMATFYSLAGAVGAFIATIIIEPGLGKQTYFAMGIACDAMLNKPPLPAPVQAALMRASEQFTNQKNFEDLTDPNLVAQEDSPKEPSPPSA
jgi:NhaP-type Na+/H+ or K+/H+ antiporter